MTRSGALLVASLALGLGLVASPAHAQAAAAASSPPMAQDAASLGVLRGRWVRPDGGYVIDIKSVGANGKLDAAYANPSPLPFYTAEAKREGKLIKLYFELRAGGYNGSNYTLTYNPDKDTLEGVYFQAVAQQRFDVYFTKAK